jgi:hypothetical protein
LIAQDHEAENAYWFADIDNNGRADRLLVRPSGEVVVWRNDGWENGKVSWAPVSTLLSGKRLGDGEEIQFGDFDGDGRDDCLITTREGEMRAYTEQDGVSCKKEWLGIGVAQPERDPKWVPKLPKLAIPPDAKIRFADVDGNKRDDFFLIHPDGKYQVWANIGSSRPWDLRNNPWQWVPLSNGATLGKGDVPKGGSLQFSDVNGDGWADLLKVSPNGAVTAWPNRRPQPGIIDGFGPEWGDSREIAKGFPESEGKDIHFADVDGDGRADYLRSGNKGLTRAWLNRANLPE